MSSISRPETHTSVLLVDDEALYLASMERLLRRMKLPTVGFTNPKEALRAFENDPDTYSLLITDHRMPDMAGLELAGRVHGIRESLPILICSGYIYEIDRETASRVGVREILAKPQTGEELRAAVRRVLAATHRARV